MPALWKLYTVFLYPSLTFKQIFTTQPVHNFRYNNFLQKPHTGAIILPFVIFCLQVINGLKQTNWDTAKKKKKSKSKKIMSVKLWTINKKVYIFHMVKSSFTDWTVYSPNEWPARNVIRLVQQVLLIVRQECFRLALPHYYKSIKLSSVFYCFFHTCQYS